MQERKDFRVVFVNPTGVSGFFKPSDLPGENLGIAYLAAVLRGYGYSVKIIDQYTFDLSNEKVVQEVMEFRPSLIGISPIIQSIQNTITIGQKIKQLSSDVHVTLGGHHASFAAEEILENERWCDSVVKGYGEETIIELAEVLCNNSLPLKINGVWYRNENGEVIKNPDRLLPPDLEKLPLPARDVLEKWLPGRIYPACRIATSRGCFRKCSFCSTPPFERLHKPPFWQARSPQNVVEEIEILQRRFGIRFVFFIEDNFFETEQGAERAAEIADEIIKRNIEIKFTIFARADILLENIKCLRLLKRAGLNRCFVGLDSLIQDDLEVLNKGTTVNQNIALANLLFQEGIILTSGFINLHPYASLEGLHRNAKALLSIGQAAYFWNFTNRLQLYPGASIVEKLKEDKLLLGFNYKSSPYTYKYKDERIEALATALGGMKDQLHTSDRLVLESDILVLDSELFLARTRGSSILELRNLVVDIADIKKQLAQLNYNFFLGCLNLAENGWDSKKFMVKKGRYLKQLSELVRRLEKDSKLWK